MSDLPPADWYTDPDDDSQYRYWDGSSWTEHRAPRHTIPEGDADQRGSGMRGPLVLLGDTISMARRRWRNCALAALILVSADVILLVLAPITANSIVMGELGEIMDRIFDPAFDPSSPADRAYFESLDVDLSPINFVPLALALLYFWVATNLAIAAVTRVALSDLKDRELSVSYAFKRALGRVPRLMGVDLQVAGVFAAAVAVAVFSAVVEPLLLILVVPVLIAAVIVAIPVVSLAYVVASVGPAEPSLRCAWRRVRGRFWGSLGRILLISLGFGGLAWAIGSATASFSVGSTTFFLLLAAESALFAWLWILEIVAPAILYFDLGGESD